MPPCCMLSANRRALRNFPIQSSRGHRAMSVIQITRLDCCDHPHRSLGRPEQLPDSIN